MGISGFLAGWGGLGCWSASSPGIDRIKYYYKTEKGRWQIDSLLLKTPIFGSILRKVAVARFSRILSTLLSSGVPILQSLDITAKTAGNVVIEDAILKVRAGVERGENFVEPLKATKVFPHMVGQMIGVGEQTGALDAMLGKIADFYEEEVDTAIADLLAMIEPVLIASSASPSAASLSRCTCRCSR
jgi:type IV pilus assembly protein PilC